MSRSRIETSADPAIATVDEYGVVSAAGFAITTIVVQNGGHQTSMEVRVLRRDRLFASDFGAEP